MNATANQMKYIASMRQCFTDYDKVIGGEHQVPTSDEAWSMTKVEASKYISANKEEFNKCWKTLIESNEG